MLVPEDNENIGFILFMQNMEALGVPRFRGNGLPNYFGIMAEGPEGIPLILLVTPLQLPDSDKYVLAPIGLVPNSPSGIQNMVNSVNQFLITFREGEFDSGVYEEASKLLLLEEHDIKNMAADDNPFNYSTIGLN